MALRDEDTGDLPRDYILKAIPRVRVRPLPSVAAQAIADRLAAAYAARLDDMLVEIDEVLRKPMLKSVDHMFVLVDDNLRAEQDNDLVKAARPGGAAATPKVPKTNISGQQRAKAGEASGRQYQRKEMDAGRAGSRGGKFYVTDSGKIRYGTKPVEGEREARPDEMREHFKHYGAIGRVFGSANRDIEKVVRDLKVGPGKLLTKTDLQFLDNWNDVWLPAFMESYNLTAIDMEGDLSARTFDNDERSGMSYEEAVAHFVEVQLSDLDEKDKQTVEEGIQHLHDAWDKALLDPAVQRIAQERATALEKHVYEYFTKLEAGRDSYEHISDAITSGADPGDVASKLVVALGRGNMNLIFKPTTGEATRGHLKGCLAPNTAWLSEDKKDLGSLLAPWGQSHIEDLTPAQAMAMYVGASLNALFQPDARYYQVSDSPDTASPIPSTKLGEQMLELIGEKGKLDTSMLKAIKTRIDATVAATARMLNAANTGLDHSAKKLTDLDVHDALDGDSIEKIREEQEKFEALCESALAAQTDTTFALPASMTTGVWGSWNKKIAAKAYQLCKKTGLPWRPFMHQVTCINWCKAVKRGIIADDAGMGKTPTVISLLESLREEGKCRRGIIIVPPSLMAQWPGEIAAFAPNANILSLSGMTLAERKDALKSDLAKNADYIIMSAGTLTNQTKEGDKDDPTAEGGADDELMNLIKGLDGGVFVDEAHSGGYKTPTSVRHQMLKHILEDREYAFGMTATPMPNDAEDLYHLTNLFAPGSVGDLEEWEGNMHGVDWDDNAKRYAYSHPENFLSLNLRTKPFVLQRLITDKAVEDDMGKQLDTPNLQAIDVEPHGSQPEDKPCPVTGRTQLDYIKEGGICYQKAVARVDAINEAKWDGEMPPALYERMVRGQTLILQRQAAISPELIDSKYRGGAPKMERIVSDLVAHFKGGGGNEDKPVVMFSSLPRKTFPIMRRMLAEAGIDPSLCGEIHGGKSQQQRAFMQDMTNAGKIKVLLVGTLSGGAGLNLQKKASAVMFIDDPWNPAAKRQAIGRVWRTGQQGVVNLYNYRTNGSVDMDVEEKIAGKQALVTALTGKVPDEIKAAYAGMGGEASLRNAKYKTLDDKDRAKVDALFSGMLDQVNAMKADKSKKVRFTKDDPLGDIYRAKTPAEFLVVQNKLAKLVVREKIANSNIVTQWVESIMGSSEEAQQLLAGRKTQGTSRAAKELGGSRRRQKLDEMMGNAKLNMSDEGEEFEGEDDDGLDTMPQDHQAKAAQDEDYSKYLNKDAQKKLASGRHGHVTGYRQTGVKHEKIGPAPALAGAVELGPEFRDWRKQKREEGAVVARDSKVQMAKFYETKGDKKKAEAYRKRAAQIEALYPAKFGKDKPVEDEKAARKRAEKAKAGPAEAPTEIKEKGAKGKTTKPATKPADTKPEKKAAEPKSKAKIQHKAGVGFTGAKPYKSSDVKTKFGKTGMVHAHAAHLLKEFHANKDKTMEAYADRVLKPLWNADESGKYSTTKGVALAKKVIEQFRKDGVAV